MSNREKMDQQLREVVQHAVANAPAVQARFAEAGLTADDIQGVADLVKLPIFPKDELIQRQNTEPPFGGFLGVPLSEIRHIYFSPGPLYEPGVEPDDPVWEVAMGTMRRANFVPGDVVLNSFSYHLVPAGMLFDQALSRLGCIVVPGGVGNRELQLKMMTDLGVTGYAGTPSFLMQLIQKAEEMGLDFRESFKLEKAIFSAEPLPPSLRAQIEGYGISVANAYGTAEFGILAMDTGQGPMPLAMQLQPEPLIEVLDPDTGEPVAPGTAGEVVVTNFSKVYPMLRLGTGDMAMNLDPNPGQSAQSERAIILVGRSGDAVKVRGMFLHPNQIRFATSQIPGILKTQAIITRPDLRDHVLLRVEAAEGVTVEQIGEPLKQAITAVCRVKIDDVAIVPQGSIADDARGVVDERVWE